jgi:hypothetical protein
LWENRRVEIQDLAKEFRSKTDEELLRLALEPEQLTPEANAVLNDELAHRRIKTERLNAFPTIKSSKRKRSVRTPDG